MVFATQMKAEHRWRSFADCDIILPDVGVAMRKAKAQDGAPCVAREIHMLRAMWSAAMSAPTRKACAYCLLKGSGGDTDGVVCSFCHVSGCRPCAESMLAQSSDASLAVAEPRLSLPGVFTEKRLGVLC